MKKKVTKKPAKKSGSKAASIAGKWLKLHQDKKATRLLHAVGSGLAGDYGWFWGLIDDIDTLAASVLSQKEGK